MAEAPQTTDIERLEWSYEFVPSRRLPALDLSRSIKSRYLPPYLLTHFDAFLKRYNKPLFASYIIGLGFSMSVPLLDANAGRYVAFVAAVLAMPLGLGSLGTLRFDVVRLLLGTYDFWFFFLVNGTTNLMIATMLNDLRMTRLLLDWTGFQNVVLIDAQLRGIRQLSILATVGTFTVLLLLVCVMLGRVDGIANFSIMTYHNSFRRYEITARDIVGNGLVTMSILLLKIVYRKRKLFSHRKLQSSTIECAIYRCGVKLTPCSDRSASTQRMRTVAAVVPYDSDKSPIILSDTSAAAPLPPDRTPPVSPRFAANLFRPVSTRRRQPCYIQQVRYVESYGTFDSRKTIAPVRITSKARIPNVVLLPLYICGVGGFLLTLFASVAPPTVDANAASSAMSHVISHSAVAFTLSTVFTSVFGGLYQRELFRSLVSSFDYVFYAAQLLSIHVSLCVLYDWELQRCLSIAAAWVWIQWVLTLDALTPMMKTKLHFHIRFAIPVVAMFILWHITTLATILGDAGPPDHVIWEGTLWGHVLVVRVVPFYFSRLVTLTMWCCRLVNRLARASNDDANILRGAVAYENYLARESKLKSRTQSLVGTLAPRLPQTRIAPS